LNRVCVDLKRNASSMITNALKIKSFKTAALPVGGSSLRHGIVADSTRNLFAGSSASCQWQLLRCIRRPSSMFEAVQNLRSIIQIRFSNRALYGIEFLVSRWSDRHLRRNYFALGTKKSGATEVSRSCSSAKSHKFGWSGNAIDLQSANRQATSNVTELSAVGTACPSLSNHGSQKNQIHAIRLFESCLGSPINRQQRRNSNEKNNANQCVASRGKSDCDC